MLRFCSLIIAIAVSSCSTDRLGIIETLGSSLANDEVVRDNVIACAASDENSELISVFFYPRAAASNFKYFETVDASVDKNDFDNYIPVEVPIRNVFNGFLKKFQLSSANEKWVIVTFEEDGMTHLSNPIRLKQNTKPTEYIRSNITIDSTSTMPSFSWQDGLFDDTKIYFHVVSNASNDLLSGTYTFERNFQYYKLDNVVLNITPKTPPNIEPNTPYNFTLLGVSEDNWVNLFSELPFQFQ